MNGNYFNWEIFENLIYHWLINILSDYPITPENLEIIKSYRQMLREFINTNEISILSGEIVEIPPLPEI